MNSLLHEIFTSHQTILLGIVKPQPDPAFDHFKKWIEEGKHGEMRFLERYQHIRRDPSQLEPAMGSVMIGAYPYGQKTTMRKQPQSPPLICQYAKLADYHKFLKTQGAGIMEEYFQRSHTPRAPYRVVVDSAPILEKSLAVQTGAGFMGKNTLFISPSRGSLLLLFEIYTAAPLAAKPPQKTSRKLCGTCQRCKTHCPTGALDTDYVLDATKCLAYYTIEHRSVIPVKYWKHLGEYYFGCDICQLVCPFNRFAKAASALKQSVPDQIPLDTIACMNQKTYADLFGGSPMTRAKRQGLRRNALIAMHVTHHPKMPEVMEYIRAEGEPLLISTLDQIPEYTKFIES